MVVKNHNLVDIDAELVHETDDAFLINDGDKKVWCPKSLTENNRDGTFTMPEWFAEKAGLV